MNKLNYTDNQIDNLLYNLIQDNILLFINTISKSIITAVTSDTQENINNMMPV